MRLPVALILRGFDLSHPHGKAGTSGTPPPIFCKQIPCFLEFTGGVALQNLDNKEVSRKIFQDKELRGRFGLFRQLPAGRLREEDVPGR
jgi:hypothetical protein